MKQSEKNLAIIVCILILACIITVIAFIAYFIFRTKPDDGHTHSYSETVISPTCTESGYTLHSCACGESYKDAVVAATGHSPKAAVTENEVTADCTKDGGYDEVVYCNECGEKLSTEHKTIQKLGHTPKAAVTENEVTADCSKDGGYDIVVYCDECGEKLSTEHKTIEKLAHNYEYGICSVCKDVHYNVEDLKFTLSQDQSYYAVSGYNGNPTYANIPDTYLDKPVTSIASSAFYKRTSLISVTIPESVTYIGSSAFEGCKNLTNLLLPDGPVSIEQYAFYECTSLTNLIIPDGVDSIGNYAFYGSGFKSITIGKGVTSIGEFAFGFCISLENVYWNATNCIGGWFDLSIYRRICPIFHDCPYLTTIVIGENVQSIPDYLFYYCENVKSITIPDSVTSIGNQAFWNCSNLQSVTIGKGVTTIDQNAFAKCTSLEIVYWNATYCTGGYIEDGLAYLVFGGCKNLTTLVIGDGVEYIPDYAFYECTGLQTVILPVSIELIGKYAFYGCSNLKTVFYLGTADDSFSAYESNSDLINALYRYSEDEPEDYGRWWHYDEDGNMAIWEEWLS